MSTEKTLYDVVYDMIDKVVNEKQTYYFALREDLKDDSRFIPTRATDKATGWDVRAALKEEKLVLRPFEVAKIPLGIRGFCPEGWWYKLVPRSSTFGKKNLHCLYGTIDEDYEGELIFACQYIPAFPKYDGHLAHQNVLTYFTENTLQIDFADALGQIIPEKRQNAEVVQTTNEELDALFASRNGKRGAGGFGSTGK